MSALSTLDLSSIEIPYITAQEVVSKIEKKKHTIFVVGFGVDWSYPAKQSLYNILEYIKTVKSRELSHNIDCLFINEENDRQFCEQDHILAGTPVLRLFYNGAPLLLQFRGRTVGELGLNAQETRNYYFGQTTKKMIQVIVDSALSLIEQSPRPNENNFVDVDVDLFNEHYSSFADTRSEDEMYDAGGGSI
eukprot:gb/GECH01008104.1/.p1 GENE.gb/GECH01008104.1/~~gb/GECH01008104.1/.p1  ORF type:complete len:191 (+),score=44.18 gb/GECH01008104.1/:1-573(+)